MTHIDATESDPPALTEDVEAFIATISTTSVHAMIDAGWRPPARVITGTIPDVMAALDVLTVGTVIRCDDNTVCGLVYQKLHTHPLPWYEAGSGQPVSAENIARHEAPIEILT